MLTRSYFVSGNIEKEFDPVLRMLKVFQTNIDGELVPSNVINGYYAGVWSVEGWRKSSTGVALKGWVAVGGSYNFLYFDEPGIVVGMQGDITEEFWIASSFARLVRKIEFPFEYFV